MKKTAIFKLTAGLILPVLTIVLLELFLDLVGIESTYEKEDPFLGFQQTYPIFEKISPASANQEARYGIRKNKLEWFNEQEFIAKKPKNGYRIFCFGGSTTAGRPYTAQTAFPNWLNACLRGSDGKTLWEVINVGGVSYASYRIVNLMKEMVHYQPDLFIVYTGHNEFLEERTYAGIKNEPPLITGTRMQLNKLRTYSLF